MNFVPTFTEDGRYVLHLQNAAASGTTGFLSTHEIIDLFLLPHGTFH